jgi:tetratricopeptide (TPR) repeat protein
MNRPNFEGHMRKNSAKGNPQIYHYLKKYQEDPTSRVFAPLAEAYRKAGLLDEAIDICRDGLRIHPNFIGGRVALARAFFDKRFYEDVVKELEPVIADAPDNLVAQRLLADSYLILGRIAQALNAYKVLLYFTPQDIELGKMVKEIEMKAYEDGALVLENAPIQLGSYSVKGALNAISEDPMVRKREWMKKIEGLQSMLMRVQRFKLANNT